MVQPTAVSKDLTKNDATFTQWTTEKRIEVDPDTLEETEHWYMRTGYVVQTDEGETIVREIEVELKGARKTAAQTAQAAFKAEIMIAEGITV